MLQNFLQSTWWTEYTKSNNIWIISTDDINQNILAVLRAFSKYSSSPKDILKSEKKKRERKKEKPYTK